MPGEKQGRVAAERAGVQPGGGEGTREQGRTQLERPVHGDGLHVPAGFRGDIRRGTNQHEAARREDRFRQFGVAGRNQLQGPDGELLHHRRTVARDQLAGGAGGRVVRQLLLSLHQRDAAAAGQLGGQGQAGNAAAHDQDIVMCCHPSILAEFVPVECPSGRCLGTAGDEGTHTRLDVVR